MCLIHPSIETSFFIGGILNSDNFVLRSGPAIHLEGNWLVDDHVLVGVGSGYEHFGEEQGVPVYLTTTGLLKKNKSSGYFTGKLGYTFMHSDAFARFRNHEFQGGIRYSIGTGYKIALDADHMLMFGLNFMQQFARITYTDEGTGTFEDALIYSFIGFHMRLILF